MNVNGGPIENRKAAGRMLAACLNGGRRPVDPLVMAVPPGGVPVGLEVAHALDAELDLMMVRKLAVPGRAGLAMGAVAGGGVSLRNDPLIREAEIGDREFQQIRLLELVALQQHERLYRGVRPPPRVQGRSIILVDDGLASGITMRAAIRAARHLDPLEIVVLVPVASAQGIELVREDADEVVCLATPEPFLSVELCYRDFTPVSETEVHATLQSGWTETKSGLEQDIAGDAIDSGHLRTSPE
jgi:putative phosphoribosyl transferase